MQQHYQLSQLEKRVRVDLKELSLQQTQIDRNYFSFITNDVISQKREILSSFRKHFYSIDNQHQAVWYVRQYQHQLIMLLDQINTTFLKIQPAAKTLHPRKQHGTIFLRSFTTTSENS
ncbi:hypothetical protein SAMN04488128_10244 [Chitinophaga eiseniae]|uniref:Uncharacterized protein n=1 Tax=Chitinophaga eiseniae TaxID=634771 RepID=A0A1T4PXK9_9BACT|nr:hypothetical protein SAMN04488128_10244 [Chitinophaga eiseniae]